LFKRHELGNTLGRGYTDWLEIGAEAYGRLFKALADPGNLPLLFHCTAGKDRAGIGVAILLALLGVPEETIVADYSLSNLAFDHLYADFLVDNRTDKLGIAGEEVKIMLAANPAWIKSTLKHLHEKYGGAEAYLKDTAGLSQGQIEAIRKNILADPINEK
jgi:protein-tyrosine phosphatase